MSRVHRSGLQFPTTMSNAQLFRKEYDDAIAAASLIFPSDNEDDEIKNFIDTKREELLIKFGF